MSMSKTVFDFIDLLDFSKLFGDLKNSTLIMDEDKIDLSTKEGLDKFNEKLDIIENNELSKLFMEHITGKKIYELRDLAKNYFDVAQPDQPKIDDTLKDVKKDEIVKHEINRPSKNIEVNIGLQIHKLVQEYIDTMIKPYAKGIMNDESINDAYAGLYEFACWIYNK